MPSIVPAFDLDGRVALVTGAGQGIGSEIAAVLAARGAAIVVNDVDASRAAAAAEELTASGAVAVAAAFDVTDLEAVRAGVRDAGSRVGPVDILVNNAGVPASWRMAPFRALEPEEWAAPIALNLFGVLNTVSATVDGMCDRGYGRIVTISSAAAQIGMSSGLSLYAAGKAGAEAFTRHLAVEVAGYGVTANTLSLGLMATRSAQPVPERAVRGVPAGRLGTGADVGAAVVWLAAEGSWVTGQTIGINGGNPTR